MLTDIDAQEIIKASLDLLFSDKARDLDELIERAVAKGELERFPKISKEFERVFREKIKFILLVEMARWN